MHLLSCNSGKRIQFTHFGKKLGNWVSVIRVYLFSLFILEEYVCFFFKAFTEENCTETNAILIYGVLINLVFYKTQSIQKLSTWISWQLLSFGQLFHQLCKTIAFYSVKFAYSWRPSTFVFVQIPLRLRFTHLGARIDILGCFNLDNPIISKTE